MRRIVVELHARAVELAGAREIDLGLHAAATGEDLKRELARRHPALAELLPSSAVASEGEYLADAAPLGPGVRFHLIPPVSGG